MWGGSDRLPHVGARPSTSQHRHPAHDGTVAAGLGGSEREVQQTDAMVQGGWVRHSEVARLLGELVRKDEQLERMRKEKDQQLERVLEKHREDMKRKDEQLGEDMKRKDEQLERVIERLRQDHREEKDTLMKLMQSVAQPRHFVTITIRS